MARLLSVVLISIVAVAGLYLFSMDNPQQILVELGEWQLKTNLFIFSVGIIALFIVLVLIFKALNFFLQLPMQLMAFNHRWNTKRAQQRFGEALVAYACGHYQQSIDLLVQTKALSPTLQGAVSLIKARCYMHCGDMQKAGDQLTKARLYLPEKVQLDLLETEILSYGKAPMYKVHKLSQLINDEPDNLRALRLLINLCGEYNLWKEAGESLLRRIRKNSPLEEIQCKHITQNILKALFADAAKNKDYQRIHWLYKNSDCKEEMEADYAHYLAIAGAEEKAEKILCSIIEKTWNEKAITYFSSAQIVNGAQRRLDKVRQWLEDAPNNSALLVAAARLYRQCGLTKQAEEYDKKVLL